MRPTLLRPILLRPTLFISDLHLSESRPELSKLFFDFLKNTAATADTLYILGDLFEVWLGDDQLDHDPLARQVADALRTLTNSGAQSGLRVFFMHGNRDFLIGERFAREAGLTLLNDPTLITLNGQRCLLLHGDTLCTDDVAYQAFRTQARDPTWQAAVFAKPYRERVAFARNIRQQSNTEKSLKAEDIMDVSRATVEQVFRNWNYPLMIHGHTHRPATHDHEIDGQRCIRHVLADWRDKVESLSLPPLEPISTMKSAN